MHTLAFWPNVNILQSYVNIDFGVRCANVLWLFSFESDNCMEMLKKFVSKFMCDVNRCFSLQQLLSVCSFHIILTLNQMFASFYALQTWNFCCFEHFFPLNFLAYFAQHYSIILFHVFVAASIQNTCRQEKLTINNKKWNFLTFCCYV